MSLALARAASAADVYSFDLSRVRLGMTPQEVRSALVARLNVADDTPVKMPVERLVSCDSGSSEVNSRFFVDEDGSLAMSFSGRPLGPLQAKQILATQCVGDIRATFGKISEIVVTFEPGPHQADFKNPVVGSIQFAEVIPGNGRGDSSVTAPFFAQALKKYGKPTVSEKYQGTSLDREIWCADGTSEATCLATPKYTVANNLNHEMQKAGGPGLPAKAYLAAYASKDSKGGPNWYGFVDIVDMSRYDPTAKQPEGGINL